VRTRFEEGNVRGEYEKKSKVVYFRRGKYEKNIGKGEGQEGGNELWESVYFKG